VQSASELWFDEAYYQRYYFDKKTSVVDPAHAERLGAFVCSYLHYLRVPVARVLDMGCGIGLWRDMVARHLPGARYHGVEYSAYLCERFGWERGSVVDYQAGEPFDFVICQGVLPYLGTQDLRRALDNLGRLCRGALYLG
jgi:2-polyprenyl-3-methyl-5-hydroxy-6-metoxy-1,4-benzoquinol methylase